MLGVFSTPATAASRVYEIEIDKRRQDVAVFSEPCPELAPDDRGRRADAAELAPIVEGHVEALTTRIGRPPDRAILGCTHYEIIADLFRAALPPGTPLIHQPGATADALERYLARHPEYDAGDVGRAALPDHRPAGPAERPGRGLLGRAAALRGRLSDGVAAKSAALCARESRGRSARCRRAPSAHSGWRCGRLAARASRKRASAVQLQSARAGIRSSVQAA